MLCRVKSPRYCRTLSVCQFRIAVRTAGETQLGYYIQLLYCSSLCFVARGGCRPRVVTTVGRWQEVAGGGRRWQEVAARLGGASPVEVQTQKPVLSVKLCSHLTVQKAVPTDAYAISKTFLVPG